MTGGNSGKDVSPVPLPSSEDAPPAALPPRRRQRLRLLLLCIHASDEADVDLTGQCFLSLLPMNTFWGKKRNRGDTPSCAVVKVVDVWHWRSWCSCDDDDV